VKCRSHILAVYNSEFILGSETPDFIAPALWPPDSPDLNPVDYTVWSVLQERVYRTKILDVDELKRRINSAPGSQTAGPILTSYTSKRVFLRELHCFLGLEQQCHNFMGQNPPKPPPKIGPNRHFPAKMPKSNDGHISPKQ